VLWALRWQGWEGFLNGFHSSTAASAEAAEEDRGLSYFARRGGDGGYERHFLAL
jgi:hypothetical protein